MSNLREGAAHALGARHGTVDATQEALREQAVGDEPPDAPTRLSRDATSLLRPQQQRDIVWRWHTRRRGR